MATRYFILSFVLLLSACGDGSVEIPSVPVTIPQMLDYGRSYFFVPDATRNRLYISVDSRMTLSGNKEFDYLLLSHHPRENTFKDDGHIYDQVISASSGASLVTFMIDQNRNSAIISRRFDIPNPSYSQTCGASPYAGGLHKSPKGIHATSLREVYDISGVLGAAYEGNRLLGVIEYTIDGTNVRIEFPVGVMNINPATKYFTIPEGKAWQVASVLIPIYIPGSTDCESVRNGYAAFGKVGPSVTVEFVYLCHVYSPRESQDYTCTQNYTASVRLFEVI